MQKILTTYILSPLSTMMGKLSQKARDRLFLLGGLGLVVHYFMRNMGVCDYRFLVFFAISSVFLGLMILGSLGGEIKPLKFNKVLAVSWFAVGLLMLQSGIRNNISYLPDAVLILVVLPILYICWGNADRTHIFDLMLKLCKIALVIFTVGSFMLIEIKPQRYAGLFSNTNSASYFLAVSSVAVVVDLFYTKKFSFRMVSDILLIGIATALNYYTNSRTGPLAVICAVVIGAVLFLMTQPRKNIVSCLVRCGAAVLSITICMSSLVYVFQLRQWLPLPYFSISEQEFYENERWEELIQLLKPTEPTEDPSEEATDPTEEVTDPTGEVTDPTGEATDPTGEATDPTGEATDPTGEATEPTGEATDPTGEATDPTEETKGSIFFGSDGFSEINDKKTNTTGKTADQFSTGRISVWLAYARDLNWFGHETTPAVYIDLLYREITSTHMTILQVAYESGIFAGVMYLIMNITSGIYTIIFAWKNRKEKYALLPLMMTVTFGVLSMLGSCRVMYWYWTTMVYYLLLFCVMVHPNQTQNVVNQEGNLE